MRSRHWFRDLGVIGLLLALPLILFWSVTVGSRTLVPADNLYQWEPYLSFAQQKGVTLPPHNELLSDLVLENLVWKQFFVESLRTGEVPLWNPHLFAGVPFLAAGQHSALYPLSTLYYALPLTHAYGWFTVLQLWLAGVFMYALIRVLRLGRFPGLLAGITYQLSAFFVVSVVFPMIIAAAAWLPLLLAVIEIVVRKQEEKGSGPFVPIVYIVPGAIVLGLLILAGHPEILVYTLLVLAYYAAARLILMWRRVGSWRPALRLGLWLGLMVGLGLGVGSVQLIPMLELVTRNFREGSVTLADVRGWAYPVRQIITFFVPDFYGNPAHHGYWDLVSQQWVAVDRIFWGIKNYVEAGSYVGILPLLLAGVAIMSAIRHLWQWLAPGHRRVVTPDSNGDYLSSGKMSPGATGWAFDRGPVWIFALLVVASLLFVFGTPFYALLYYGLPGIKQLHSPFRWVFPYTLSIAVLAAYGLKELEASVSDRWKALSQSRIRSLLAWGAISIGLAMLVLLGIVLVAPEVFIPLANRFLLAVEKAQEAFNSGRMLLSYQWCNFLILALMLTGSGMVLLLSQYRIDLPWPTWLVSRGKRLEAEDGHAMPSGHGHPRVRLWQPLAVLVLAADLLVFAWGFNPAVDPALLEFVPPSIQFLQDRAAEGDPWRLTTYRPEGSTKTLNPNIPWFHGLQDVRGYDSIIPAQYVQYMRAIEAQHELLYNQVAAIYDVEHLSSPLLDLLGVRYVATEGEVLNTDYALVYDGEMRIYENTDVLPRAFALPQAELISEEETTARLASLEPRRAVLLDEATMPDAVPAIADTTWPLVAADVVTYAGSAVFVDVEMPGAGWLVLADSYFPGWKAYRSDLYPLDDDGQIVGPEPAVPDPGFEPEGEEELTIVRADGNFRAVFLPAGAHRVRFKYTPMSFKLGLYGTFLAVVVAFLLGLYWLWGRFYTERDDDPTVKRVAKNSLLPMGLQLLNKVIDFAFAMLMLRILAPEMAGRYYFAVAFIGYADILVRFGLGTLLTREVAKDRAYQNRYLSTVTVLRALLWLTSLPLMAVAILVYVLFGQMTPDIVVAIALFALGLVFSSLADGFSAIFYAHEKMEYPAAISTMTALTRVSLGTLVLLLGWGFVGLAGVSVIANVVSAIVLGVLMVRHCFRPGLEWDPQTG
ncbi:MAG: oligosaccharide flippase family protein, partial [Anaerolineae bacterium]